VCRDWQDASTEISLTLVFHRTSVCRDGQDASAETSLTWVRHRVSVISSRSDIANLTLCTILGVGEKFNDTPSVPWHYSCEYSAGTGTKGKTATCSVWCGSQAGRLARVTSCSKQPPSRSCARRGGVMRCGWIHVLLCCTWRE
jgi:hypothetical protein